MIAAAPPLPGSSPGGDHPAGTEALHQARQVLADLIHFDTNTVVLAADVVAASPDAEPDERAAAKALADRLRKDAA